MKANISNLNETLYESIDRLLHNNDENSPYPKLDVKEAQAIANLAEKMIEGFKIQEKVFQTVVKYGEKNFVDFYAMQTGFIKPNEFKQLQITES